MRSRFSLRFNSFAALSCRSWEAARIFFVDKIVVHAPDRSSGERMQEVDIYLKFIGKFDVPLPEPTPEELAEQERLRKKREKQREYSRRSREKKKRAEAQS